MNEVASKMDGAGGAVVDFELAVPPIPPATSQAPRAIRVPVRIDRDRIELILPLVATIGRPTP